MHIHKPEIVPEFYCDPDPRVLYVVQLVDGTLCNVDGAKEAVELLDEQCRAYVQLLTRFGGAGGPE